MSNSDIGELIFIAPELCELSGNDKTYYNVASFPLSLKIGCFIIKISAGDLIYSKLVVKCSRHVTFVLQNKKRLEKKQRVL